MRKKKLLCIILSIFMVINLLPVGVTAGDHYVSTWSALQSLLDGDTDNMVVVGLTGIDDDFVATTPIKISGDCIYIINMNGITLSGGIEISNGANVTINGGTLTNENGVALSVYASGDSKNPTTVTISNDVTIEDCDYGIVVYPSDGTNSGTGIEVTVDGDISATTCGICVDDSITSSSTGDTITVNGEITSTGTGIAINGNENVVVNGSVTGATGVDLQAGSLTVNSGAEITATTGVGVNVSQASAVIGSTYYYSLEDAFAAVASTSGTVTLLKDVTLNNTLEVALDDNAYVTLELNGHTITFAYENGLFNGATPTDGVWGLKLTSGNLTIMDSTDDETGGIKTADVDTYVDPVGATGSSKLYILNGNYSTNSIYEAVVFANDSATVYIWGGTFTNSATSYAYRSDFSGIILNIGNNTNATITASGGTFIGQDPASGDDHTQSVTTFVDIDCVSILEGSAYIIGFESDIEIDSYTNGTVTTSPSGTAVSGQTVTITAEPDAGYRVASVSVIDIDNMDVEVTHITGTNDYTFKMPMYWAAVTVVFEPIPTTTYTVNVDPKTGGTAYASVQTANEGDTVTITTLPDSGYTVGSITCPGVNITTVVENSTYTFTMPAADVTVTVTFTAQSQSSGKGEIGGIIYVNEEYHGILLTQNGRTHILSVAHTVDENGYCTVCKAYIGLEEEEESVEITEEVVEIEDPVEAGETDSE